MSSYAASRGFGVGRAPQRARVLVGAVLACIGLGAAVTVSPAATAVLALLVFAVVLLFVLPLEVLPLLTIAWLALVPVNDLPLPAPVRAASPGLLILVVWLLRREAVAGRRKPVTGAARWLSFALVGWLLITTVATISASRSLVWDFAFVASVVLPVYAGFSRREARMVIDGLVMIGIGLALFAIAEYLLHRNPLLGHLYAEAPFPVEQRWSTYRVTTLLGHPLNNGLFFAIAAVAGFARYLETRRSLYAVGFLLTLVALFLTGSRGPLYVVPVCAVAVVAMEVKGGALTAQRLGRLALIGGIGLAVAFGLYSQTVGARADTTEAQQSTQVRARALNESFHLAKANDYLGSGPGTSNEAKEKDVLNPADTQIAIESSYLQLLVSIGIVGVGLVLALLATIVGTGFRRGNAAAAGALLAACLVIGTYNFIEGVRPDLLLLGVLGACCMAGRSGEGEGTRAPSL